MLKFNACLVMLMGIVMTLLSSSVSAEIQTLPAQKMNACIDLPQICSSCSFVNISSIKYPNSTIIVLNQEMTKNGVNYNYTTCDTSHTGTYIVTTCGDKDGTFQCTNYDFEVTGNGNAVPSGIIIVAFLIPFV